MRVDLKVKKLKEDIISAGEIAVRELIKVAKEDIIKYDAEDDLAADRLKNAAATKKLAIFEIKKETYQGFAEKRSK